jgi:2-polyprenyl-3-methyl-5-hydroxy-6-metoxy-1,4-benzoquinol methylase
MKKKDDLKYYNADRIEIKSLIPENVKYILDVGCGTGATWTNEKFTVTGIEINNDIAQIAEKNISTVIVGDVEKLELSEKKFDCIVFADILEHLYNPWEVLKKYSAYLNNNGYVVASIPNIQFYKILRKLVLKGEWQYKDYGILDIDHIRFFTYKSILELFNSSGFKILKINRKIKGSKRYRYISKLLGNAFDNFLTAQFIILGKKNV